MSKLQKLTAQLNAIEDKNSIEWKNQLALVKAEWEKQNQIDKKIAMINKLFG